jgi:hypothetical protein
VLIAVARRRGRRQPMPSGSFERGYWLVVVIEVAALAIGLAVVNGPLDAPQAAVAWISFVVGLHFVALAVVFGERFFHQLGGVITACGLAGLVLAAAGATSASIATAGGIVPGAMLLAAGWWGARQAGNDQPDRRAEPLANAHSPRS